MLLLNSMGGDTMSDNKNERLPPLSNDEWFERHVVPHINNIEKGPDDHYHLAVALCWNRHKYVDDYAGTVELAAFPKMCITPQKWAPNFAHAVRFWKTLKAKLDTFSDGRELRVDIRLYLSGASGPNEALRKAFTDAFPRKGLPYFKRPILWEIIPMKWNAVTKKYEEELEIESYPICTERS